MLEFDPTTFKPTASHSSVQSLAVTSADAKPRILKRIIVCCDGTWQDGLVMQNRWQYTNILRLSRCIHGEDTRHNPPIPQIVLYQSGIGSDPNLYSYLQGTTGASLAEKVEEVYAFIAQNYHPGDEIFLFGFSRGAYTARMVASFISAIGVLNRTDMVNFASIFINFQKRGKTKDEAVLKELNEKLAPWTAVDSPGKRRATANAGPFSIKCVGVFDTVGSLGLPGELTRRWQGTTIFGFGDKELSPEVANAFQALAINETRADFSCCEFQQSEEGKRRGQVLKQCWFAGSHSDIGGGWQDHDLADLTLTWMAAHIGDMLSLDLKYLASLPEPVAPWGYQQPHDPTTGIFMLAHEVTRSIPTSINDRTQSIHPSVLAQSNIIPLPDRDIIEHPEMIHELTPLEKQLKERWPYDPNSEVCKAYNTKATKNNKDPSLLDKVTKVSTDVGHAVVDKALRKEAMGGQDGPPVYEKTWLAKLADETHLGPYLKAFEWGH